MNQYDGSKEVEDELSTQITKVEFVCVRQSEELIRFCGSNYGQKVLSLGNACMQGIKRKRLADNVTDTQSLKSQNPKIQRKSF